MPLLNMSPMAMIVPRRAGSDSRLWISDCGLLYVYDEDCGRQFNTPTVATVLVSTSSRTT